MKLASRDKACLPLPCQLKEEYSVKTIDGYVGDWLVIQNIVKFPSKQDPSTYISDEQAYLPCT